MKPKILISPLELRKDEVRKLKGVYLNRSHYDAVVGGEDDIVVMTASGRWLLRYCYSPRLAAVANQYLPVYLNIPGNLKGRGSAVYKGAVLPALRKDGTTSRCERMVDLAGLEQSRSVNIGYEAGNGRNPYAHPTKFVRAHQNIVERLLPHMRLLDQEFARIAPKTQMAQLRAAQLILDWMHRETSFSSWIYNNWWRTVAHYDRRMFGPSIMTAIIGGAIKPDSGRLIFPRHRVQPAAPAAVPTTSEKPAVPANADLQPTAAPAPALASKPGSNEAKPTAASSSPAKAEEKIGPKLRRKDEILRALRAGSKVEKVDGLFRIVAPDGSKNATSKRRILSLESQKLLVASADGKSYTLDAEADKKVQEPKAVAVAKPTEKDAK